MNPYPVYKESGVPWLGEVPEHWKTCKMTTVFSFGKGLSITKADLVDYGVPVISYGQIHSKTNSGVCVNDSLIRFVDERFQDDSPKARVRTDDIIFADTSEDIAGVGNCVRISEERNIFAGYHTIIAFNRTNQNTKYWAYLFQSETWRSQLRSMVNGVKVFSVSQKLLRRCFLVTPPPVEQTAIVAYLDAKCAQIDELVARRQGIIVKLRELKQAIIAQTVTKGLNPHVPMKDSGVDWLGEVPEHWKLGKIKHIADFSPRCKKRDLAPSDIVGYAPMECIKQGYFVPRSIQCQMLPAALVPFDEGDIVMAKVTPCFENGNIAIMEHLPNGIGFGSSELFVLRSTGVLKHFLFYWLQNPLFKGAAASTMTGAGGLKRVSPTFVRDSRIPIPPLEEQAAIAAYLDEKCARIDELILRHERTVEKLKELKAATIAEVVTGKVDVRKKTKQQIT